MRIIRKYCILILPNMIFSLNQWINYIQNINIKSIDLSLDRMYTMAVKLKLLQIIPYTITVGGTNGKGTTCCLLENILLACNKKVGVYTSPHLLRYTERVRIQGKELSEKIHCKAMEAIENARGIIPLTYFEFSTLATLWIFQRSSLDIIILEVGLGGRLDATNIIDTDLAVITNIALDHMAWLGFNRNKIAIEKSGIFRSGKPVVIGDPSKPVVLDVLAKSMGVKLYSRNIDWYYHVNGRMWTWWNKTKVIKNLPLPSIPIDNAATVLATVNCLPFAVPELAIKQGLHNAFLQGRFQCIQQRPITIIDIAHNPHAANYLSNRLYDIPYSGKLRAIVGMLADKDISNTLACLHKQVAAWYCTSLNVPRSANAATLAYYLNNHSQQFNNVLDAWDKVIIDSSLNDCILIFGSVHAIAPILTKIQKLKSL